MTPQLIQVLNDLPSEELRQVIAFAAGIHAHRDGDNGEAIATVLRRIGDRLSGQPRKAMAS